MSRGINYDRCHAAKNLLARCNAMLITKKLLREFSRETRKICLCSRCAGIPTYGEFRKISALYRGGLEC